MHQKETANMADRNAAPSSPSSKGTDWTNRLFEACVEADWASADILCDEYTKEKATDEGETNNIDWSDAVITTTIDGLGEENRLNPLMAAVLHVAIDVAASTNSFSLFSDTVTKELVDAEERKRLQSRGVTLTFDNPVTTADFCPYVQMRKYGDTNYKVIGEEDRRARRKAIAKLCRANPLWIILPMIPRGRTRYEEDPNNFDDDLPRGTTPLHVAVRSRNVTLTRLLIKYCPKAAEIADLDGCIPLHYAVRPSDETTVLRRAVLTYQRSLNGGADNAPLETGPNEVHSGANLYYHGKILFKATHESSELSRCRVRRMRRMHKLRTLSARMKRLSNASGKGSKESDSNDVSNSNNQTKKSDDETESGNKPDSEKMSCNNNQAEKSNGSKTFTNMYDTPSLLVRAMMNLGTIEEDATDLVQSEWNIHEDDNDDGLEARKCVISTEYPIVMDDSRTITHHSRSWKTERQRTDVVKLLTLVHPQGMLYQCDDGGDTPLILACQTLEGDDGDDDEEFGDLEGGEIEDAPDEIVEDAADESSADYEMDLPQSDEQDVAKPNSAHANAVQHEVNGYAAPDQENIVGENDQHQQPGPNNGEQDPLEAVMFMVAENGNAMGVADDDGDTALHAATRIGASPRLVQRLLNAMPALASTPAEDGSTPLHLACRRACHLAPEGNGGMGTYEAASIRMLADAAGPGTLIAADDEGRTPFHVACRYRASPAVLAELADSDGGRSSLLIRDTEGHAPLGVYSRHATDYHGLRVLVDRCPEAAAAMGDGRHLPLHRILATFNLAVNVDCLRLLGAAYPRGLDALDSRGMTPLALLCESYRGPLEVDIPKLRGGRTTLERCLSNKIWLMAKYLILASKTNRKWKEETNNSGDAITEEKRVLHATLREPTSSVEIVQLATIIHHNQFAERDSKGDLPLHLCCRRRQSDFMVKRSFEKDETESSGDDDDSVFKRVNEGAMINEEPVDLDTSNKEASSSSRQHNYNPYRDYLPILHDILQRDKTAAARCNNEGQFPLNLLIDKGSTWRAGGVDAVLKAWPQALFSFELSNSLFAKALARTASYVCSDPDRLREEQALCIGATFQLLRGKPTALESASSSAGHKNDRGRRKSKRIRTKK